MTTPRSATRVVPLALAALMATAGLASAAAPLALDEHGGATRNDGDRSAEVAAAVDGGPAHNVILLIGDGMGDSEITSARNYEYGAAGRLPGIDALPLTGQYTTYSLTQDGEPDYTPDSASTATAFATGTKTYDSAISVDIGAGPQRNLLELAKARGLRTGNVSTAYLQDATPASQTAHVSSRGCTGPTATSEDCPDEALENGGLGSISEQLIGTRADVTLGGGAETFEEVAAAGRWEGRTLLEQATDRGYQLVDDLDSLQAVASADQDQPLLGLFAPDTMPVRWVGPEATAEGGSLEPARCEANPERAGSQPTLQEMTDKAIELLADDGSEDGFFLQVEGASIDKQDHAADACGQIGEMIDLDEAVQSAMAFAREDGNTSVFVTADHAHTSQIIEAGSTTPGLTTNLLTNEGQPMTINYATGAEAGSQQHTGTQLRVAGYGPQAANVTGLTDQTDLFFTMARALELSEDPAELSADAAFTLPSSSRARSPLPVDGTGFSGDFAVRLSATQGGRTVDLGQVNVYAGTVAADVTTPDRVGRWTVTATGVQSGQEVSTTIRVAPGRTR